MDIAISAVLGGGGLYFKKKSLFSSIYAVIHSFRWNSQPDNTLETQVNIEQTLKSEFPFRYHILWGHPGCYLIYYKMIAIWIVKVLF